MTTAKNNSTILFIIFSFKKILKPFYSKKAEKFQIKLKKI